MLSKRIWVLGVLMVCVATGAASAAWIPLTGDPVSLASLENEPFYFGDKFAYDFDLFGFATGEELSEHTASMPAIIQIIKGEASLTIGNEAISGQPGTWIHMAAKTPHSVKAESPAVMLLTLLK